MLSDRGKCGARLVWGPIEVAYRFARTGGGERAVEDLCGINVRPSPPEGNTFFKKMASTALPAEPPRGRGGDA